MKKGSELFQKEFERLNPDQKKAVTTFDGPVLVVAGPGTGKTQVLSMRIAHILLHEEIKPQNILALTFTESGVVAMKERLISLIGTTGYYVTIKTFHSFCNDIILEFPEKFSYRTADFTNLTDIERFKIIRQCIDDLPLKHLRSFRNTYFFVSEIIRALQSLKKEGITPKDFEKIVEKYEQDVENDESLRNKKDGKKGLRFERERKKVEKNKELSLVYNAYQEKLKKLGRYDYEDMIMFVVDKIRTDEELKQILQERYHHFLIDEYQDTNGAQNFVVYQLAHFFNNPNLFVVGDDDQSIYRFQGASLENMLYMNDKFEGITTAVLKINYRSSQTVVDASMSVIENNEDRITNPLYGFQIDKSFTAFQKDPGDKLSLYEFSNGDVENYFIVTEIEKLIQEGVDLKEIAIMYRNNKDASDVMEMLNKKNIPWVMEGGFNILEDHEIQKIVEFLKIVADPDQGDIFFRILHHPVFDIPALDLMKFSRLCYNHKSTKKTMIEVALETEKLKKNRIKKVQEITNIAEKVLSFHKQQTNKPLVDIVEGVMKFFGLLDFYIQNDALRIMNRINSLFSFAKKENHRNHRITLQEFLDDLEMMEQERIALPEQSVEVLEEGVRLMTAHRSKGLEFDYVFITKCIDGKWGNNKKYAIISLPPNVLQEQELKAIEPNEDERRLFYVALTRAKKKLFISYAREYPVLDKKHCIPSQFIGEINQKLLLNEDSKIYEKQAPEIIALLFSETTPAYNTTKKQFFQGLIEKFRMNPVALNTYIDCPRRFLYEHLVRVPRMKNKLMQYGTAVHTALENFFRAFRSKDTLPSKEHLIEEYTQALEKEIMPEEDFNETLKEGQETLSAYYEYYQNQFEKPLYLERDYNRILLHLDEIPLSGKIDKIERIDRERNVTVIDYKTGRPRSENEIKGLTASSQGKKYYFYQLLFYKLLLELDKDLGLEATAGVIDFVYNQNKNFQKTTITFEIEEYESFKTLLKDIYRRIRNMEFDGTNEYPVCNECQYCQLFWKETLF